MGPGWYILAEALAFAEPLDAAGFGAPGAWVAGGGKSLGEAVGVWAGFLSRSGWKERGGIRRRQAGSQARVASWEMAEAPDVLRRDAREGERNRVLGTQRQWRW